MDRKKTRKIVRFVMEQTLSAVVAEDIEQVTDKLMKSGILDYCSLHSSQAKDPRLSS